MAPRAKPAEPEAALAPEPKLRKCCGTCKGWRPKPNLPAFGECMPSLRAAQAPLVTPDLSCCSMYEVRQQ